MSGFEGKTLPLTEARHPALRQALDYWRAAKDGRDFPSRNDISPEGMKPFLQHVMLIDVEHRPLDFIYRVFGTGIAAAHRKDYTGKSVRDLEPAAFAAVIRRQYGEVLDARAPLLHGVLFSTQERYFKYQRLTLPLSTGGADIDKLLAISVEDPSFWAAVENPDLIRLGTAGLRRDGSGDISWA